MCSVVCCSVLFNSQAIFKAQTETNGLKLVKKGYKLVTELNSDTRLNMSYGVDQMPVEVDIELMLEERQSLMPFEFEIKLMPEEHKSWSVSGEDEWIEEEPVSSTRR